MKFKSILFFSALLAIFSMAIYACADECPACVDGAECQKGVCVCESDRIPFGGQCIAAGENTYFGVNSSCYCYDTLIFGILSGTGDSRTLSMGVKSLGTVGSMQQSIFYYELPSGDSIWSPQIEEHCFAPNGWPIKPALYGKKLPDDSWRLKLVFHHSDSVLTIVDSCSIIAKRFK